MGPNHWPMFMGLAVALGFGSFVTLLLVFAWKALRHRTAGWVLDCFLLGASGFILVLVMMGYLLWTNDRLPKEIQRVSGPLVLAAIALALVRAGTEFRQRVMQKKKFRSEK